MSACVCGKCYVNNVCKTVGSAMLTMSARVCGKCCYETCCCVNQWHEFSQGIERLWCQGYVCVCLCVYVCVCSSVLFFCWQLVCLHVVYCSFEGFPFSVCGKVVCVYVVHQGETEPFCFLLNIFTFSCWEGYSIHTIYIYLFTYSNWHHINDFWRFVDTVRLCTL